ncbi:MAG: DUF1294 domain-containing protein [Planctomycetes bacterium]|jgi:uncharacterized membrane protein YsdA (DUF1294 family)|nr:DUF1294 domain-containing protein [Planctomycetota bacterium]
MLGLLWGLVLVVNVATALVFGFDKWRARRNGRRVPERKLLWLVFATGWIGAWAAMALFRHKTVKQPFRRLALLWTVVNPFWLLLWQTVAGE